MSVSGGKMEKFGLPEPEEGDPRIATSGARVEGAWTATPISLCWPMVDNQNYLPPGKYRAKLEIKGDIGMLFTKDLEITSPRGGEKLDLRVI